MTALSRRSMLAGGSALLLAPHETLARMTSSRAGLVSTPVEQLVCVHLRGGADALSLVVPHSDPEYYRARPRIAVPPPGAGATGALDLDGDAGLHPALAPLLPAFGAGELFITLGAGLADPTRSHFESRRRLRALLPAPAREGAPDAELRGAARARAFADELLAIAARIQDGKGDGAHWVEHDGWDTHVAQPARVARLASELALGLSAFHDRVKCGKSRTLVAVFSEFGRTLHENVTSGTGDGHGGVLLLLGASARGGRVLSDRAALRADPDFDALPAPVDVASVLRSLLPTGVARSVA